MIIKNFATKIIKTIQFILKLIFCFYECLKRWNWSHPWSVPFLNSPSKMTFSLYARTLYSHNSQSHQHDSLQQISISALRRKKPESECKFLYTPAHKRKSVVLFHFSPHSVAQRFMQYVFSLSATNSRAHFAGCEMLFWCAQSTPGHINVLSRLNKISPLCLAQKWQSNGSANTRTSIMSACRIYEQVKAALHCGLVIGHPRKTKFSIKI